MAIIFILLTAWSAQWLRDQLSALPRAACRVSDLCTKQIIVWRTDLLSVHTSTRSCTSVQFINTHVYYTCMYVKCTKIQHKNPRVGPHFDIKKNPVKLTK